MNPEQRKEAILASQAEQRGLDETILYNATHHLGQVAIELDIPPSIVLGEE